jgi:hypothetical protein
MKPAGMSIHIDASGGPEQQDPRVRVLGEPAGDRATGEPAPMIM